MARGQQQGSVIRFEGTFDEQMFRSCVRLFMRPHEWEAGWWFIIACSIMASMFLFFVVCSPGSLQWWQIMFLILGTICICYIILGLLMVTNLRCPRWNSLPWKARASIAFYRMQHNATENPICENVPNGKMPKDHFPPLFGGYALFYLPFGFAYIFNDPFRAPIAYGVLSRFSWHFKNVPQNVKLEVTFSGAFLPDRILKGSHDRIFADSYADVHDVVEDQRRYPGLAIIRHQNAYSQLVVFTDKLEGGTWDDVKRRILAASPKALPRKERRRLSAEAVERA